MRTIYKLEVWSIYSQTRTAEEAILVLYSFDLEQIEKIKAQYDNKHYFIRITTGQK